MVQQQNGEATKLSANTSVSGKAMLYMLLLAVQFGIQPILSQRYTSPTIIKSTVVLTQEVVKFVMAFFMLSISGSSSNAIKGI
jgi:solute carrier family 35 (UDP-sugar transporter), member A1/2/3